MAVAIVFAIPLGHRRRGVPRAIPRSRGDDAGAGGDLDAELLARAAARDPVRRQARMAAGLGIRHAAASRAAGGHARHGAGRDPRADDALVGHRGAARALRAGGAGARAVAGARRRPPRVPQQPDPGRHHHRPAVRRGADRHDHHRDDLRMARRRPPADPGDQHARLSAGAGLHPVHLGDLRGDEPDHRPDLRLPRSAGSASNDEDRARHRARRRAGRGAGAVAHAVRSVRADAVAAPRAAEPLASVRPRRARPRHPGAPHYRRAHLALRRARGGVGLVARRHGARLDRRVLRRRRRRRDQPGDRHPHFGMALAFTRLGKTSEAIQSYQAALQINPKVWEAELNWGIILLSQQDFEGAISHFQKAKSLNQGNFQAIFLEGKAQELAGNLANALASLLQALPLAKEEKDRLMSIPHLALFTGSSRIGKKPRII